MLGAIIGDIVGSPYEFTGRSIKTTDFPLFSPRSRFTDDTVMTCAVAKGLLQKAATEEEERDNLIDAMHEVGREFPRAGYGQRFVLWIYGRKREPLGSYGNGSAMRVSAVGWMFDTLAEVEHHAAVSAAVSHNHPEGIKGAQSVAGSIFLARKGATHQEIRQYVTERYGYDLSRTLDDIRPGYRHIETCQQSVPEAITAFLESTSYEDAIRKAVSLGGDSDTQAAIAGSIAQAAYGEIPMSIVDTALQLLPPQLLTIVQRWHAAGYGPESLQKKLMQIDCGVPRSGQ